MCQGHCNCICRSGIKGPVHRPPAISGLVATLHHALSFYCQSEGAMLGIVLFLAPRPQDLSVNISKVSTFSPRIYILFPVF